MKKGLIFAFVAALAVAGCNRQDALEIPTGSDVTVEKKDGVTVEGKLIEVKPDQVVLQLRDGGRREVARADISALRATPAAPETKPADATVATTGEGVPRNPDAETPNGDMRAADPAPAYREVTIPAGTTLKVNLGTTVASDSSNVEDAVRGTLRSPVTINGVQALPAGTAVTGHVTDVARSGRVKGRARVAFRFTRLDPPGAAEAMQIRTASVSRVAPGTKKKDAATIGGGAVGGAIIGGLIGGGDGAAKGAAIGGAGGTGVVVATRGKEVRIASGTPVSVRLTAPLTVRVTR